MQKAIVIHDWSDRRVKDIRHDAMLRQYLGLYFHVRLNMYIIVKSELPHNS